MFAIVGFGLPIIGLWIAFYYNALGSQINTNGIPWCFITNDNLAWFLFFYPIIFFTGINTIFVTQIIVNIIKSYNHNYSSKVQNLHMRPLIYLIGFLVNFLYVAGYVLYSNSQKVRLENEAYDYLECILLSQPIYKLYGIDMSCTRPAANFYLLVGLILMLCGQGIFASLIYMTFADNFTLWAKLINLFLIKCGCISEIEDDKSSALIVKERINLNYSSLNN